MICFYFPLLFHFILSVNILLCQTVSVSKLCTTTCAILHFCTHSFVAHFTLATYKYVHKYVGMFPYIPTLAYMYVCMYIPAVKNFNFVYVMRRSAANFTYPHLPT